jgi:hypothetical protein
MLMHVDTGISGTAVHLRYADTTDPLKAAEWVDIRVLHGDLKLPSGMVMTGVESHYVSAVKLAALRHALGVVTAEIERLRDLQGRNP